MANLGFGTNNQVVYANDGSVSATLTEAQLANASGLTSSAQGQISTISSATSTIQSNLTQSGIVNLLNGGAFNYYITGWTNPYATNAAVSTDGITWTLTTDAPISLYDNAQNLYANNTAFMISSGTVAYTTNFTTWSSSGVGNFASKVAYGSGLFVAPPNSATNLRVSTDGITWTTRTLPSSIGVGGIAYGNGRFAVVPSSSSNGSALHSTDAVTWTTVAFPANINSVSNMVYGDKFVAIGRNSSNLQVVIHSTDGLSWTSTITVGEYVNSIAYGNGFYVVCSSTAATLLRSSSGTGGWSYSAGTSTGSYVKFIQKLGQFVRFGTNAEVSYSTDGASWTKYAIPASLSRASNFVGNESFAETPLSLNYSAEPSISATTYTVKNMQKHLVFNSVGITTVTLPSASAFPGRELVLKQIGNFAVNSASSNVVPLTSETAGTAILSGAGKYARLVSNGINWRIIRAN